jgi:hypothetical protein
MSRLNSIWPDTFEDPARTEDGMFSKSNKPSMADPHVDGVIEESLIIDIDLNPVSHSLRKSML